MSTERLLVLDGVNYSGYITENDMSVKLTPVYDEKSKFVAMDGNTVKNLLGYRAQIGVSFSDIDRSAAASLGKLAEKESFSGQFAAPDLRSADFSVVSVSIEPEKVYGEEYWSAALNIISDVILLDGL